MRGEMRGRRLRLPVLHINPTMNGGVRGQWRGGRGMTILRFLVRVCTVLLEGGVTDGHFDVVMVDRDSLSGLFISFGSSLWGDMTLVTVFGGEAI